VPEQQVNIFEESEARRLWAEHRERVINSIPGEIIDFAGMKFPNDPDGNYFHGLEFKSEVDFSDTVFEAENVFRGCSFLERVQFYNAKFLYGIIFIYCEFFREVDFNSVQFDGKLRIAATIFHDEVNFSDSSFEDVFFEPEELPDNPEKQPTVFEDRALFCNCIWKESASFDQVEFNRSVVFDGSKFKYNSYFFHVQFKSDATFKEVVFEKNTDAAKDARRNLANFSFCKFESKADFPNVSFECKATFLENMFNSEADFLGIRFKNRVEFKDNKFNNRLYLEDKYSRVFSCAQDAIVPYRHAKLSADSNGNFRWAGRYHFQEQCAINEYERKASVWNPLRNEFWSRSTNGSFLWGEFFLGRLLFGYGEKPLRPLGAGVFVIVLCAVVFCIFNGLDGKTNCCSIGNAFYFSIVTFTTLGYGDITAIPNMRWLAATEAILGAALMSLFIVALARKFSR
jgi:hypothetical protein